jgi:predicted dehydrogenase
MIARVKIGFIGGCGHHYLKHIPGSPERPADLQLAVAGDGHDDLAASRFAASMPDARWFDTAQAMFEQFKPDVVSVGAVYGFNGEFARQAMARDLAVVCDKPVAATWDQFHALGEQSTRSSRPLLTELPTRWDPGYDAARQAVANGAIGAVALARALRSYRFGTRPAWYADRASFSGLFLWVGSHEVDVVRFVTGDALALVAAHHGNVGHAEFGSMEDHAVCLLSLAKGGAAVVEADYLRPATAPTHGDIALRVAGSAGVLDVRIGSCKLIAATQASREISPEAMPRPFHQELLEIALGKTSDRFSTSQSLELAELMLKIRDLADSSRQPA